MLEIVLEDREVVVREHELKNGAWIAKTLFEAQDFFAM
jgi:hypothetical protein